jgi:hypothetical protein
MFIPGFVPCPGLRRSGRAAAVEVEGRVGRVSKNIKVIIALPKKRGLLEPDIV